MKTFNSLEEMKPYYNEDTNTYEFDDNVEFWFDLDVKSHIIAWDINAENISAWNIYARKFKAWHIKAWDIYAEIISAWSIIARDIKVNKQLIEKNYY